MAEQHDNTKPAQRGTFSLSRIGSVQYFPIEEARGPRPLVALIIHEKPDGTIVSTIDTRFNSPLGELDE
jgi:hypothetical protein